MTPSRSTSETERALITSRHNAIVARYRAVARGEDRSLVLLDGIHLVGEALTAGIPLQHVALASDSGSRADVAATVRTLSRSGAPIVTVSPAVMSALSPVRSSSPIVALAARPSTDVRRVYAAASTPLVIIAADVQDPGNVGAIVRVAEAAGATGVVVAGVTADPFGWKALRGSMGSALRLPIGAATDVAHAVDEARAHGCRIVATAPRDGHSTFAADFRAPAAILIGGEGTGLSDSAIASADERVTIPMRSPVESLNAAVTAAVILYEARRQRDHEAHEHPRDVHENVGRRKDGGYAGKKVRGS